MEDDHKFFRYFVIVVLIGLTAYTVKLGVDVRRIKYEVAYIGQVAASPQGGLLDQFNGLWDSFNSRHAKKETSKQASQKPGKMTVSYVDKVEDRYVEYSPDELEYLGTEEGTVVVNVVVSEIGQVTKTSINASSTITDEAVLDAARRFALKTHFNYNTGITGNQRGQIIFTYKKK